MTKQQTEFEALLEQIKDDPISGALAAQKKAKGVRALMHECSVGGYAVAYALQNNPAKRKSFYALDFWDEGYTKNTDHLLQHALQFTYGSRKGSEGKRAEDHGRIFQPHFKAGKTPEEMHAALKKGGFDALKKGAAALEARDDHGNTSQETPADPSEVPKLRVPGGYQPTTSPTPNIVKASKTTPDAMVSAEMGASKPVYPNMSKDEIFSHLLLSWDDDNRKDYLATKPGEYIMIFAIRDANQLRFKPARIVHMEANQTVLDELIDKLNIALA